MKTGITTIWVFIFLFFAALSFGETTYFDQNGNLVSKEEFDKISKKWGKELSGKPPGKSSKIQNNDSVKQAIPQNQFTHPSSSSQSPSREVQVNGNYNKSDVYVRGYTRANGTYVAPHMRTAPDKSKANNYSTKGNVNPYTGKRGSKKR